ncbi:MAG: undecaprenyldiphospho-muramoylpentapeptide beta-N-acetylglucosaminyltransferase [Lactobacillales bacterium]|jgi:UDP-N-acetylglucosamine--N-acetylmuramyl-(pentapeptide) pyrophosphoryl-undecaprenol N-acetylglucosamine transferase|nr:undecaprenyldiphospho-muramoylpentapeptide beta-N-acetylglucosaminyltransferase [Lactobacillales bacterium]
MRVLVSGGGTGGHIYPALAFLRYVKSVEPASEFLFVGTTRGLESRIVPAEGIDFAPVEIQGIRRSLSPANLKTAWLFLKGLGKSKQILRDFKPDVVLGTGGYVAGPVVYEATKLGIPTVIHEQNSFPGVSNKFVKNKVDLVFTAFPEAEKFFKPGTVQLVGNPRGEEVANVAIDDSVLSAYGLDPAKKTVVIFGGSRGSLTINESVIDALGHFEQVDYQILYACGEIYWEDYKEIFAKYEDVPNIKIVKYISNMPEVLKNSDLVVGRAGATSIAEITALGLPAILIPSPNVTADHQTKNAMSLVNAGAAKMITDAESNGVILGETIDEIIDHDDVLAAMSEASFKIGIRDTSQRMYKEIKALINEKN